MRQRYSCVRTLDNLIQKYGNTNIVNIIDRSYIKADNSTIFNWLQNNMEFISKISATDANIDRAILWILKTVFTATVHGLGRIFIEEYNPIGCRFWIHLYNKIYFEERIEAIQYIIHLYRGSSIEEELDLKIFQPSSLNLGACNENQCLNRKLKLSTHNRE